MPNFYPNFIKGRNLFHADKFEGEVNVSDLVIPHTFSTTNMTLLLNETSDLDSNLQYQSEEKNRFEQ